jgi:hypothetical protein
MMGGKVGKDDYGRGSSKMIIATRCNDSADEGEWEVR